MVPILILAGILLVWGGHLAWRWKQARDFAPNVLAARQADGDVPADVTAVEFTPLYLRSEGPRAATYFYLCALTVSVLIAPVAGLGNAIWVALWRATGRNLVFETGTLIHTFTMFLIMMGFMILVLAIAMRRYHTKMPPPLKHIIRDLNGDPS